MEPASPAPALPCSTATRTSALLFLAGASLGLLHFLLAQQIRVAVRDPEMAVLVVALAYFAGVSLGYALSDRLTARHLVVLLPVVLLGQLAVMVGSQSLAGLVFVAAGRERTGAWAAAAAVGLLVTVAGTAFHAVFLPRVIAATGELRRCYAIELAGSLAGLGLVLVAGALHHALVLVAYLASFLAVAYLLGARRALLALLLLVAAGFAAGGGHLDRKVAGRFYARWYAPEVEDVEHATISRYHKIEVARLWGGGRMLLLDGRRQFTPADHGAYSYFVAAYPARLLGRPSVCVLGCGSMSTVGRLGEEAASITIVDLDEEVFRTSRRFFASVNRLDELRNWRFIADDAKHFLGSDRGRYDLILDDIPPAWSRQVALTYTETFFRLARQRLSPRGIFSMPSLISLSDRSPYGRRLVATMMRVFERHFVIEHDGAAYFYGGGPGMVIPDRSALRAAIDHRDRQAVRILLQPELSSLVSGEPVITVDNLHDLIHAD